MKPFATLGSEIGKVRDRVRRGAEALHPARVAHDVRDQRDRLLAKLGEQTFRLIAEKKLVVPKMLQESVERLASLLGVQLPPLDGELRKSTTPPPRGSETSATTTTTTTTGGAAATIDPDDDDDEPSVGDASEASPPAPAVKSAPRTASRGPSPAAAPAASRTPSQKRGAKRRGKR